MSDLNPYEASLAIDLAKAQARIKALTEQLEAARADAKEAEAYAEELEQRLAKAVGVMKDDLNSLEWAKAHLADAGIKSANVEGGVTELSAFIAQHGGTHE